MVKENVNVHFLGFGITTMLMYKAVFKLFMKSAYSQGGIPAHLLPGTRPAEIALFMIYGAPSIVAALMTINTVSAGGSKIKITINIAGNNELEGAGTSSGSSSSSSLFLFLNKLPN
jgi:hypothetical protein